MVINTTFNNISVTYVVAVSFMGEGSRSTQRKLLTCCKLYLKTLSHYNLVSSTPRLSGIQTHKVSGCRH